MLRRRALVAVILLAACAALAAQSDVERRTALLESGPFERRGIEYFAPDLTAHWFGIYESPAARVQIYYAEQPLEEAAGWTLSPCGLVRLREDGRGAFYYLDDEGWSVLIVAEQGEQPAFDQCSFASQFVRQFQFFQNLERSVRLAPSPAFPAIVEY